jgi:hypothetical protein
MKTIAGPKQLLLSGVLSIASYSCCYNELVYALRGHQTQATVTSVHELHRGTRLYYKYAFTEPDRTRRTGSDTVDADWDLPRNGTILVQYTAGADGQSRLSGNVVWDGIAVFALSVVVFGYYIYRLGRKMYEAIRPTHAAVIDKAPNR